jgi:hypothetical protein
VAAVARAHPALAAFTLTYLVAFAAVGVRIHSDLAVPYLAVVTLLVVAVCRLERRFRLGAGVLWALSFWGLAHMAGGIVPLVGGRVLYGAWVVPHLVRYDQAVHAFGFGYATFACGTVLRAWLPTGPPSGYSAYGPAVFAALAALGIGALNEVVEFLATLVLDETHVGGFENTGWDLIFNLGGASVAGAWLATSAASRVTVDIDRPGGSRLAGAAQGTRCEPGAVPQL